MPLPLIVRVATGSGLIVNALALGSKTMPLISVLDKSETAVVSDVAKVAVSLGPLGTVGGAQLAAVFQSPSVGFRLHVALPPNAAENGNRQARRKPREAFIAP